MTIRVHPGLATWNKTEYADGLRARFAAIAMPESASHSYRCGWEDADTEMLETERHRRVLKATKTTLDPPGVCSSTPEPMRECTGSSSMRAERHLGKRAGSTPISTWEFTVSEESHTTCVLLSLWANGHSRLGVMRYVLHAASAR